MAGGRGRGYTVPYDIVRGDEKSKETARVHARMYENDYFNEPYTVGGTEPVDVTFRGGPAVFGPCVFLFVRSAPRMCFSP